MILDIKEQVKNLPSKPGVYLYRNIDGEIIYVGKAKNLKSRVSSYFIKKVHLGTKTQALVSRISQIEYIQTSSEFEALLLEATLVKKHYPKYNVLLKDDKSYLYIVIRKDVLEIEGVKVNLPKILTARKTDLQDTDIYFGPYPDGSTAKYILKTIRKIFPFRDCTVSKFNRYAKNQKPCLYGYIGLCTAPCLPKANLALYKKQITSVRKFLRGESKLLINEYTKKMQMAAKDQQYELAAHYRDVLKKFAYITTNFKSADKYVENPNLVDDLAEMALSDLKTYLPVLKELPKRIECYDISNISGKDAVGSMVVAIEGQLAKSEYRKFKIKTKDSPDDFAMMHEVLNRRLTRDFIPSAKLKQWGKPDLIVLDGGKGQLSQVLKILEDLQINVPVIGLAKKFEKVIYFEENFQEISLPKDSEGQKLLIKLRDESHRFAQKYHHHLRSSIIKQND